MSYELTVQEENRNETSQIAVRVLFFGAARDAVGQAEIDVFPEQPYQRRVRL